jgi:peptidyl-dipeptidase A
MLLFVLPALAADPSPAAQSFLDGYDSLLSRLYTIDGNASWDAATDVSDRNEGRATAASQATAAFVGDPKIIAAARDWKARTAELSPLQARQIDAILYSAGDAPGDQTELVNTRLAAETRLRGIQDGFEYCLEARAADGKCAHPLLANDIDEKLRSSVDPAERLAVWTASKEIGVPLKAGLGELRDLRNNVARKSGYSYYFA